MRIFKRRVGHALVGEADASMQMADGDRVAVDTPADAPGFRDDVLRELSKAAREALAPVRIGDNQ
jgi:hypothetical protein